MRLAVDFDGTIADTNRAKADWILRTLGKEVEPWRCDRTNCVPIIGAEAYEAMSRHVYERESTLETSEVPGAVEALRRFAATAELHIVTARPARRLEFAREWFDKQGILQAVKQFHSSQASSKQAICRSVGASVLIDDDLRHLEDVRLAGLRRIHFQYGSPDPAPSNAVVSVCRSWPEVIATLEIAGFAQDAGDPV